MCSRARLSSSGLKQLSSSPFWRNAERYIQESKVPTLHFQPSLLRLPIPKLEATCSRYLAAQKPMLDDAEYSTTEALVREFSKEGSDSYGAF